VHAYRKVSGKVASTTLLVLFGQFFAVAWQKFTIIIGISEYVGKEIFQRGTIV
jgi:hypothetical protein